MARRIVSITRPRATSGSLSLAGASAAITFAEVNYNTARVPDPTQFPTVALKTAQGNLEVITSTDGTTTSHRARFMTQPGGELLQAPLTASALVSTPEGYAVNLNAVTLTGSGPTLRTLVVTAAVTVGKPGGSVAIGGDSTFKPQSSLLTGTNQTLVYEFRSPSTGPFAFEFITVKIKAGALTSFSAGSASGKTYNCDNVGGMFMARCEGAVGVSTDARTLTFNGFKAGLGYAAGATVTFSGRLTATGL